MRPQKRAVLLEAWVTVALLALVPFLIPPLSAQSRGAIVGTVRDPSGALVPGAKIAVTNLGTNTSMTSETSLSGDYYVSSLLPGVYRLEVEKAGFNKVTVNDVTVEVSQTTRVDVALELGAPTQTVQVKGASPLVQTDTPTLGQVITNRQVTELPLNGRDFTGLLRLSVGVSELQGGIATSIRLHGLNESFRSASVNGDRPSSIGYLIDGITDNEPLFQTPSVIPPIDGIQEFKLQNGLYSAEFGMGAAQVSVALKSGTNQPHGSLWDFVRNDAFQPMNPRFHTKTPLKQNQFGFTLGGPLMIPRVYDGKDHTFFFGSYEGGRRRTGTIGLAQVPTNQEKQGDFSDWPVQLYNPLTGMPPGPGDTLPVVRQTFPNNQIPRAL